MIRWTSRPARRFGALTGAALCTGLLAAAPAAPAGAKPLDPAASTSTTVDVRLHQIQADAAAAIANRIADLNQVIADLRATAWLGTDQGVLVGTAQTDVGALTQLGAAIAADTTAAAAAAHAAQITAGYRVYALVIPVDHLVRASDAIANVAVPKLDSLAVTATGLVTPANAAVIQPLITDLTAQADAAAHDVAGLAPALESNTPAQWDTDPLLLVNPTTTLHAARQAVAKAGADAHAIVADLTQHASGGH